jgi:hypothetical protein
MKTSQPQQTNHSSRREERISSKTNTLTSGNEYGVMVYAVYKNKTPKAD